MCDCLKISYHVPETPLGNTTINTEALGTYNGYRYWEFVVDMDTLTLWHDAFDNWYVTTDGLGGTSFATGLKHNTNECPFAETPVWQSSVWFDYFKTEAGECNTPCDCIQVGYKFKPMASFETITLNPAGTISGYNYYTFTSFGTDFQIYFNIVSGTWEFVDANSLGDVYAQNNSNLPCPFDGWVLSGSYGLEFFDIIRCDDCFKQEDRIFREYEAIKLPEIYEEENRGFFRCCCPFNVLASSSTDSWKNDITSAWIKLSDPSDTVLCFLEKNGQTTVYSPTPVAFINEPNAFYWTINWFDVLTLDGAGCYEIKIQYNISGVEQEFTWGIYNLKPFSIQNALTTARLRVRLNSHQEIEGINFSGSNVEDSIRFYGFIGNRQPKTEIDNIIYQNREMKKVIRENLNVYEVITDPTCEEHIRKLTDLYLLSENELYISDYNAFNHSYRYNDLPVILEDTAEITYFEYSREASLKCIVSDKFKNKRSFY